MSHIRNAPKKKPAKSTTKPLWHSLVWCSLFNQAMLQQQLICLALQLPWACEAGVKPWPWPSGPMQGVPAGQRHFHIIGMERTQEIILPAALLSGSNAYEQFKHQSPSFMASSSYRKFVSKCETSAKVSQPPCISTTHLWNVNIKMLTALCDCCEDWGIQGCINDTVPGIHTVALDRAVISLLFYLQINRSEHWPGL